VTANCHHLQGWWILFIILMSTSAALKKHPLPVQFVQRLGVPLTESGDSLNEPLNLQKNRSEVKFAEPGGPDPPSCSRCRQTPAHEKSSYLTSRVGEGTVGGQRPVETIEKIGCPRDSNPDMLIQSYATVRKDFLVIHFSNSITCHKLGSHGSTVAQVSKSSHLRASAQIAWHADGTGTTTPVFQCPPYRYLIRLSSVTSQFVRNTLAGVIRMARRAGMHDGMVATPSSTSAMTANVHGSNGSTHLLLLVKPGPSN
jgi:hypothetical protein